MDDLARHYKLRYGEALDHAMDGRKDTALDICWELRLDPRIGVYRRAMVNLLIAKLLPHDQMRYVQEGLDLLNIIHQENNGEVSDNIQNLIFYAEDLIEELEVEQQEMASSPNASGAVRDPTTTPVVHASMTESSRSQQDSVPKATEHIDSEMEVVVGRENGNVSNEKSSSENDTSMKRASDKSHSDIASSEKAANKKDADNKDGRIIYVYETDKDDKDGVVADRNNTVQIEGMLETAGTSLGPRWHGHAIS
ncbi:hypothetical protein PV11_02046 [Exophiala sideris]|uniref:Uncharacterized protein n=1 Tax=Exophiala sideris TaxID=1016849 RepID=A0A0D1YY05_9EURO|nr:hypothetical protein PV11_02046 [Exophiala sideris]